MSTEEILQSFLNLWNTRMQVCDGEIFRLTTEKDILQRCYRDVERALEKIQEKKP